MPKRLHKEIERVKRDVLSLGGMVEERLRMAIKAIQSIDGDLADKIRKMDHEIDEMEIEVEEECLKILALHQPVAVDLRFLIAVIKINNDLERIGDEAVNVAKRVDNISRRERMEIAVDYPLMAEKALKMVRMGLDALVRTDLNLAFEVIKMDDDVDQMHRNIYDTLKELMRREPEHVGYLINFLTISRHIERIADHATNIAEEVIYLIDGDIVRHHHERWAPKPAPSAPPD